MMDELPEPTLDAESQPFYEATAQGRFLLRRCRDCGQAHWYPRSLCPFCMGETVWVEASGRGEIYSYSVMRKAGDPYVLAYVTLAEGPTMLTNIIGSAPEALAIGLPVRLDLQAAGGQKVPLFQVDATE